MAEPTPIALVVGATSGIGFSVASRLYTKGYRVYGAGRTALSRVPFGVVPCPMDVRSDSEVRASIRAILDSEEHINVFVGGPGKLLLGGIEETSPEEDDAVWDVGYRGPLRVLREVLPSMRQRRTGRIVHLCSLLTTYALPFTSAYAAASSALLATSESLRNEVAPFGVKVSAVIATDRRTGLFENASHAARRVEDYAFGRAAIERAVAHAAEPAASPEEVADVVLAILGKRSPVHLYRVGAFAHWLVWLRALLPYRMNERGLRRHMYLPPARW